MYQFKYFVIGILAYFYSFLLIEFIYLNMKKFITHVKILHPTWPEAITITNPTNIKIVHLVLSIKFLFILFPKWVSSTGPAGGAWACVAFLVS